MKDSNVLNVILQQSRNLFWNVMKEICIRKSPLKIYCFEKCEYETGGRNLIFNFMKYYIKECDFETRVSRLNADLGFYSDPFGLI